MLFVNNLKIKTRVIRYIKLTKIFTLVTLFSEINTNNEFTHTHTHVCI